MAAKKKKKAVKTSKARGRARTAPKRAAAKRRPAAKTRTKAKVRAKAKVQPKAKVRPKAKAKPKPTRPRPAAKSAPKRAAPEAAPIVIEVATIVQEELFDAEPMDVYEALVDPLKHAAFTGSRATGEPVEGGAFTAWDGYIEGRHERLVPGARIVQVWRASDFPEAHPASRLELELRPEPEGRTRLRMTHSGVPRAQAKSYEQGWIEHYWNPLREYLRDAPWMGEG